jgi:hypothetical protein
MKVRLTVPISGPNGTFKRGDEPDLPETLALSLIRDGHAIDVAIQVKAPFAVRPVSEAPKKPRRK